jgi:hypothetical protein
MQPSPARNAADVPNDAVVLASGSPILTVVDIGQYTGCVLCRWPQRASTIHGISYTLVLDAGCDHHP